MSVIDNLMHDVRIASMDSDLTDCLATSRPPPAALKAQVSLAEQ